MHITRRRVYIHKSCPRADAQGLSVCGPLPSKYHFRSRMRFGLRNMIIRQQEWKWDRNDKRLRRTCPCLQDRPSADCCPHLAPIIYAADRLDESVYKLRHGESLTAWFRWSKASSPRRLPRNIFANTFSAAGLPVQPYEKHHIAYSSQEYWEHGRIVGTREPTLN